MQESEARSFSKITVAKPILIALVLTSVVSTAIAVAALTQWPLSLKVKVGGTDFIVYELADNLTRIGEVHEHDFGVVTDCASWFIEIENLSPHSIYINYTLIDLPPNFTVELRYDYSGFDTQSEWAEQLELQSAGEYQDVIVKITLHNQGAAGGSYSFQMIVQAV